jgi:hypothetical protein
MKMKGSRKLLKETSLKKLSPYFPTVPWESHKTFFKNTNHTNEGKRKTLHQRYAFLPAVSAGFTAFKQTNLETTLHIPSLTFI